MWKDSYSVGVALIDGQHKELFRMTDELMKAIETNADSEVFKEAINFLKKYVVYHFNTEEGYQKSVTYCDIDAHKKLHKAFTDTVLEFEKKLVESDFDIRVVKELAGMLTAWLIYHVADADQKIAKNLALSEKAQAQSYILNIAEQVTDVIEKMAGLKATEMKREKISPDRIHGDVLVEVGIKGDINGNAYFSFSKELAFKLIETMMFISPSKVDELVCSALAEISNISGGHAANALASNGAKCDITPPVVTIDGSQSGALDAISIDTGEGNLVVAVVIE